MRGRPTHRRQPSDLEAVDLQEAHPLSPDSRRSPPDSPLGSRPPRGHVAREPGGRGGGPGRDQRPQQTCWRRDESQSGRPARGGRARGRRPGIDRDHHPRRGPSARAETRSPRLRPDQGHGSHGDSRLRTEIVRGGLMRRLGLALALAGLLILGAAPPTEILVFAAASLTESMQELGKAFEQKTGTKVTFSFGPSSDLQRQISAGAPADVFFSADTPKMDTLEKEGHVRKSDRREFLSNVLVVVVPADAATLPANAKELASMPKIALADPAAV